MSSEEDVSNVVSLNVPMESPHIVSTETEGVACNAPPSVNLVSPAEPPAENSLAVSNSVNSDMVTSSIPVRHNGTGRSMRSSTDTVSDMLDSSSRTVKLSILTEGTPKSSLAPHSTTSGRKPKSVSFRQSDVGEALVDSVDVKDSDKGDYKLSIAEEETSGSHRGTTHRGSSRTPKLQRPSAYPGRLAGSDSTADSRIRISFTDNIRQSIQCSKFYHTAASHQVRAILHGKVFVTIMSLALMIALFLPDLWVVCGVNSNLFTNIILTIVMVLFLFELVALSALDVTYLLSFFFFMDIIGTISMIFDISFLLGIDNTKIVTIQGGDTDARGNLMLLRAARAARLGARAGRLSRIIKILRFLPFLGMGTEEDPTRGYAGQMSRHLSNLLGTRVACLTIILVIAIPVIDILSFPQIDHAMQTWVERLHEDLQESSSLGDISYASDVLAMVSFFDAKPYGPYMACPGLKKGDDFIVQQSACSVAKFGFDAPNRGASALWVHTDNFMVGFNMHQPLQVDHGLAMVTTCFIIVIMIFSALALSNVVTTLAVRPLEGMLKTVRQIAETVFNISKDMAEDDDSLGEDFDVDASLDMTLLEKVVMKLAAVAELQKGEAHVKEGMATEDIGILNMMEGRDLTQSTSLKTPLSRGSPDTPMAVVRSLPALNLADSGVTLDAYNSFALNTLVLQPPQMISLAVYVTSRFHERGGFINTEEDLAKLKAFVKEAESRYLKNKFHNFCHAVDVAHGVSKMMKLMLSESFLDEIDQFALLIAAIGHDLAHPGVNNGFLLEVQHELALQYNDLSPLENMHVSELYGIVAKRETNVFHGLSKEQYNQVRKNCIEAILHTDMMMHFGMVKDLEMLFQVNSEIFAEGKMPDLNDVLCQPENKLLIINEILHSADVSNPCRKWEVSHAWAHCVLDEFFEQGDEEKKREIPIQMLNDRDKINRPNSQIGFLEFVIAPFFCAQMKLFHQLFGYGDNLSVNIAKWEEMWIKETSPDEEARAKVRHKIENVKANLLRAKETSVAQAAADKAQLRTVASPHA